MGTENDSHTGHLDRLFEHRNKEYGAYAWRKAYNRQLIKGIVGMLVVVVLCIGGYYWWGGKERLAKPGVLVCGGDIVCETVEFIETGTPYKRGTTKNKPAQVFHSNTVPVIAPDSLMDNIQAHSEDPVVHIFRDEIPGIISCPLPPEPPPEEIGTDAASSTDSVEHICIVPYIENLPEYPGGREAMLRFIDSALGFPGLVTEMDSAMEAMEKVIVLAQFRIEVDGQLTEIQFPGQATEPYQTNVRRVLEAMPKWIPGTQNEKPVPMVLKLPVLFLLLEE